MLELTFQCDSGSTGLIFMTEVIIYLVISDYSRYHYNIGILSDHRLFRFANISRHLSGHHFISQITVHLRLPGYQGITPYHASLFISVCQNITTSIPYRRKTHSCCLYWLNKLCMCFNYLILPRHCDLINQLCRFLWVEKYLGSWSGICPTWQNARSAHSGHVLVPLRLTSTSAV